MSVEGWQMAVQYKGLFEEHRACASAAASYDISHMGMCFTLQAMAVKSALQRLRTHGPPSRIGPGEALYHRCCSTRRRIRDDLDHLTTQGRPEDRSPVGTPSWW